MKKEIKWYKKLNRKWFFRKSSEKAISSTFPSEKHELMSLKINFKIRETRISRSKNQICF